MRDAEHAFSEIFSVRAPRDVFAGMWSAVQCILSGVCLGVAGAIMQPIQGMQSDGVPGCFRGAALGLCTGFFLSLTGLCTGVFQAVRGALATPRALCMASKGKQWDREAATWVDPKAYSLAEEAAKVLGEGREDEEDDDGSGTGAGADGSAAASGRRVVDTYYYDQLGVPPTASQRDIRRAYFQQSRQWHPDKTSEPRAKERFQAISEAYQVLSDPARRRTYDAQGRQGVGEGFVDACVFFSVLLGADALEPLIGRLKLAEMFSGVLSGSTAAGNSDEGAGDPLGDLGQHARDAERAEARQLRREVRLAVSLAERLEAFSAAGGSAGRFKDAAHQEASEMLRKDASLERFITEIGWVYRNRGELHLAARASVMGSFGLRAVGLQLRGRGHVARQKATTARLAVSSLLKLRKIVNETGESSAAADGADGAEEREEDEMPSSLTNALPVFMETFFSLSASDITGTLGRVVERVLADTSVSEAARQRRAEGLVELGDAFLQEAEAIRGAAEAGGAASGSGTAGERQIRRFEEAFIASMSPGGRPGE